MGRAVEYRPVDQQSPRRSGAPRFPRRGPDSPPLIPARPPHADHVIAACLPGNRLAGKALSPLNGPAEGLPSLRRYLIMTKRRAN